MFLPQAQNPRNADYAGDSVTYFGGQRNYNLTCEDARCFMLSPLLKHGETMTTRGSEMARYYPVKNVPIAHFSKF